MTITWTISVDPETVKLREDLAKKFPLVSKHKISKLCTRYDVRAMAMAPDLLVAEAEGTDAGSEVQP